MVSRSLQLHNLILLPHVVLPFLYPYNTLNDYQLRVAFCPGNFHISLNYASGPVFVHTVK